MSTLTKPTNPHNNVSPNILRQDNYTDPISLLAKMQSRRGLPQEELDKVYADIEDITKDSMMGFLDMFQMNFGIKTRSFEIIETETPDYVIDDDGAVTRNANVFTIDPTAIEGYVAGEDYFFFRKYFVVEVTDNTGKVERGVITAVDKANNTFTAVCKDGASWSVATTNLTVDGEAGGDFDRASEGPEGLMELRKKKTRVMTLTTIKDAMIASGGERWAFEDENGDVDWYDENKIKLYKRLNKKIGKTLLRDYESATGSGAQLAGKYGTQGLFDNIEKNGLLSTGYLTDIAHIQAITAYYDELGLTVTDFTIHCDRVQYRHLETIAGQVAERVSIELRSNMNNSETNFARFGFNSFTVDGYTFHFSKWGLTDGNSAFGKNRVKDTMPKGVIIPTGTVKTMINGQEQNVPYVFKVYLDNPLKPGMIRSYLAGGFNGNGTKEVDERSVSTDVAIAVPVPEVVVLIK
ncbi:hypothetical protein [Polaribacter sp.]|uniref:hypothetical protein n=1 Tax=Polaribacter sp. TaxID=1920175 RepID=UPI003F6B18BE